MQTDPAPADELLRHAEFMRSLARALLRDASAADDAVQDTWLAALQRPPRHVSTARAWLGRVLRNRVREQHRTATRRAARERACARPAACASVSDVAARQEVIDLAARAVSALDEPGRSTVILRHFDGLPPREIARAMGCPVETVKSRLKRAHAQLRDTLEAGGSRWRTALVPLTGFERDAIGLTAAPSALGALVVTKKLGLALSAVIVAALGCVGWGMAADREASRDEALHADLRASAAAHGPDYEEVLVLRGPPRGHAAAAHETAAAERAEPALPGAPGGTHAVVPGPGFAAGAGAPLETLAGEVTIGAFPAREGTVRIVGAPAAASKYGADPRVVRIDEDGRFQVRATSAETVELVIDVPGHQARTVSAQAGSPSRDPIRVAFGAGGISGVVKDPEGLPAADVTVRISSYLLRAGEGYAPSADGDVFGVRVRTAADGTYAFTGLPGGRYVVVAEPVKDGHDPRNIRSFAVALAAGEQRRLDIGGSRHDPTWSGTVRYEDGSPVRRAGSMFLASQDGQRRLYVGFDAEGGYAQAVPAGTYRMEFVFPGARTGTPMRLVRTDRVVEVPEGGSREDVVLPGGRVAGRVLVVGETAVRPQMPEYVVFTLESSAGEVPESLIAPAGARPVASVPVAEDGTFAVDGLLAGVWTVTGGSLPLVAEDGRPARVTIGAGTRPEELILRIGPPSAGTAAPGR